MTIRDDKIAHEILENGGITFDIKTNKKLNKYYGYMVSIEGHESKIAIEDFYTPVLYDYIENNLTILNQDRFFLGAWVHEGFVYLDVSKFSGKLKNAEYLGWFENQIAIYDIENECEIILKKYKRNKKIRNLK